MYRDSRKRTMGSTIRAVSEGYGLLNVAAMIHSWHIASYHPTGSEFDELETLTAEGQIVTKRWM
jgi:hypothetical protein